MTTNRIAVTVVCPDKISMDRLRELGVLIVADVRKSLKGLEDAGVIEKGELLLGSPGYAIVLGVSNR